jgi:hypothetical protein
MDRILGVKASSSNRKGSPMLGGILKQSVDGWDFKLTDTCDGQPSEESVAQAAVTLRRMAPGFSCLDRSHLRTELYLTMTQWLPAVTLHFSAEFVAAVAACHLDFGPSIAIVDMRNEDEIAATEGQQSNAPEWGLAVRLWGALPAREELGALLGTEPSITTRALPNTPGKPVEPREAAYVVPLTPSEDWVDGRLGRASAAQAIATLRRLAPALVALRQHGGRAELHVVFICRYFSDGFSLPPSLIAAASEAGLEIDLLTLWPSDDEAAEDDEDEDADLDDPELIARVQRNLDDSTRRWWTPDTIH